MVRGTEKSVSSEEEQVMLYGQFKISRYKLIDFHHVCRDKEKYT